MNIFYKAYCRTYQAAFRVGMKILNFREPEVIEGLVKLPDKVEKEGLTSLLIVTDDFLHNKGKLIDGLKADLDAKGIKYVVYDKTVPNPTINNIEEALARCIEARTAFMTDGLDRIQREAGVGPEFQMPF